VRSTRRRIGRTLSGQTLARAAAKAVHVEQNSS
jgi:hypothetical protein